MIYDDFAPGMVKISARLRRERKNTRIGQPPLRVLAAEIDLHAFMCLRVRSHERREILARNDISPFLSREEQAKELAKKWRENMQPALSREEKDRMTDEFIRKHGVTKIPSA